MAFETEENIRVRAYHLWEANGRPQGRDLEFWEQARQTVFENTGPARKRPVPQSSTVDSAAGKVAKRTRRPGRKRPD